MSSEKTKTVPTDSTGNANSVNPNSSVDTDISIAQIYEFVNGRTEQRRIPSWLNVNRLQLPLHNLNSDSSDTIIPRLPPNVNVQKPLSPLGDDFPVRPSLRGMPAPVNEAAEIHIAILFLARLLYKYVKL